MQLTCMALNLAPRMGILLMSNWIVAIYTVGDALGRMLLQW